MIKEYENLITDRTLADVNRVYELMRKGISGMTAEELEEWKSGLKGAYNASDMNRVGKALIIIRDRLRTHGIDVPANVRTDYTAYDIIDADIMADYIESINAVHASVPNDAQKPPNRGKDLTWEGANNIEKTILAVDDVLESREVGWIYADEELFSGDMEVFG